MEQGLYIVIIQDTSVCLLFRFQIWNFYPVRSLPQATSMDVSSMTWQTATSIPIMENVHCHTSIYYSGQNDN